MPNYSGSRSSKETTPTNNTLPETIARLTERLAGLTQDLATSTTHADGPITIGNQECSGEEMLPILGNHLDSLPLMVNATRSFPLGIYRGLRFGLILSPYQSPELYLDGGTSRRTLLTRDHHGPRAVLSALERLAGTYKSNCDSTSQELAIAEAQLRDYESRLGAAFPHETYLAELTA